MFQKSYEKKYGDVFHPKKENWEKLEGEIEFRDVTFRYPDGGENVLEHFSLRIPAGTTVAIVGETGAGKSTLVNLACRFFEPILYFPPISDSVASTGQLNCVCFIVSPRTKYIMVCSFRKGLSFWEVPTQKVQSCKDF